MGMIQIRAPLSSLGLRRKPTIFNGLVISPSDKQRKRIFCLGLLVPSAAVELVTFVPSLEFFFFLLCHVSEFSQCSPQKSTVNGQLSGKMMMSLRASKGNGK